MNNIRNSKIRILLWDIDGTVLNFLAAERAAIRMGFEKQGLGICTDEMIARYSAINRRYWEALERGELTKPEVLTGRFREFFRTEGLNASKAEAFNNDYQRDLGETICFNDDAYGLIESLQGKVLQYAVTNGTKLAQTIKLKNSGLDGLLDGAFISEDIGVEKPMAGYFDRVFAMIRENAGPFSKEEAMIIGDSLTSDIRGGNNAGIITCWYNPNHLENTQGVRVDYEISDLREVREILRR